MVKFDEFGQMYMSHNEQSSQDLVHFHHSESPFMVNPSIFPALDNR